MEGKWSEYPNYSLSGSLKELSDYRCDQAASGVLWSCGSSNRAG
jgi:hypothetical protein